MHVCVSHASFSPSVSRPWVRVQGSQRKYRHLGSVCITDIYTEERGGVNTESVSRRFFGRGLCSFLLPTERSTEEETPIARAVSRSCALDLSAVGLCVCVCV